MDDVKVGSIIRAVRRRRGLRQVDVALMSGLSQPLVSYVECGRLEFVGLAALRKIAAALGIQRPFAPRWRGAELGRLVDERHARIVEEVTDLLTRLGYDIVHEVTFNHFGERGSIDILAWHRDSRALLVIEVKSEIVDVQLLLSTQDRKVRLAPALARDRFRSDAAAVASILVVPATTTSRRAIAGHAATFDVAFPARTVAVRRWLEKPKGDLRGIWFVPDISAGDGKSGRGGSSRVRKPNAG